MNTPIYDFLCSYADSGTLRCHMPGHKGRGASPAAGLDITEISGADSLFEAAGIIRESERNMSRLYGTADTFYSAAGSTLCIQAMLAAMKSEGRKVIAVRNVHRAFLNAAALLGLDVSWIMPDYTDGILSGNVSLDAVEEKLRENENACVYLTSPDYTGRMADIAGISAICRRYGAPLLVDNAHGAHLHFLPESRHPIALGADMCCDSAHKTLPVLTGGAYLHISKTAEEFFAENAENAMSLFASTSPSYLILQSLDSVNPLLESGFSSLLEETVLRTGNLKKYLCSLGFELAGDEPIKVTVKPKSFGYTGCELSKIMQGNNIYPEFSDPDFLVMMFSTCTKQNDYDRVTDFFGTLQRKEKNTAQPPAIGKPAVFMNAHAAVTAPCEKVKIEKSVGRVLAQPGVSCPPAVPLVTCGEVVSEEAVRAFRYYGIEYVYVVK